MNHYDIAIIGGGVVGLTLAHLVASRGFKTALIDASLHNTTADSRVSALNHASKQILIDAHAWPSISPEQVSLYDRMQVWDAHTPARITFDSAEVNQSCLGYIIAQSQIQTALKNACAAQDLLFFYDDTPEQLHKVPQGVQLHLKSGISLQTRLLVGADGKHSWVARHGLGEYATQTADEAAIVSTLRAQYPHRQTAYQRFLEMGPVALLPMVHPHEVSLVWSTSTLKATELMSMDETAFARALEKATESVLGTLSFCTPRTRFSLTRHHARRYVKAHMALVGDAAHTILPLAGQGLNLGLADVACLAQVLCKAKAQRRDFSALHTLRYYELQRKGENSRMKQMMELLHRSFSSQTEINRHLRYFGFSIVERLPGVKQYLIKQAMGF